MAEAGAVVNITQQFFGAFQLKEIGIMPWLHLKQAKSAIKVIN